MSRFPSVVLFASIVSAFASGCFFGPAPIPAPVRPLEPAEQHQVLGCQAKIANEVRKLHVLTTKQFARCLQPAVDLALDEERELTTATLPDFFDRRQRLREKCAGIFETIGRASTRMIDAVVARCAAVESLVLTDPTRGDPLGLKGMSVGDAPATVTDMAGTYCGVATASAEVLVSSVYMRTADVAWRFYDMTDEQQLRDLWQASLDPRCERLNLGL